jgi:hypothetical protein
MLRSEGDMASPICGEDGKPMTTKAETRPKPTADPAVVTAADPIAAARAEVERLHRIELEWSAKLRTKKRELAELERSSGDTVMAAINAGDGDSTIAAVSARMAAIRSELFTIERTVAAVRQQRAASIPLISKAEAEPLRARAGELDAEANAIAARRDVLLAQLQELEGARFIVPSRDLLMTAASAGVVGVEIVYYAPKSERLREQAQALRDQATRLESTKAVMAGGTPELADLDQLIDAACSDPLVIGPTVAEIEAWYEAQRARGTARLAQLERVGSTGSERARLVFTIAWRNGSLDPQNCAARIRGLGQPATTIRGLSPKGKPRELLDDTDELTIEVSRVG